jgi:osmotically-inducible protein OsmY
MSPAKIYSNGLFAESVQADLNQSTDLGDMLLRWVAPTRTTSRRRETLRMGHQQRVAVAALAFVLTSSTGCFWLAVGGAGVAGYEIGKDDRSVGTKFDDASITTGVKTKFINDDQVDAININVDTYEGVVTLNGSVPSKSVERRAVQIARSVKGVKGVVSKLVLVSP